MDQNAVIQQATFNPKVKTYIFIVVLFVLFTTLIGWVVIPFWLLGVGQWLSNKYFHTLKCLLTEKHLSFSKGFILHIEKTIPLENIQDISFIGGPILRSFGLTLIRVETAGGGGANSHNEMSMIGIDNSEAFKMLILSQREKVMREKNRGTSPDENGNLNDKLLTDIKNELIEIKQALRNGKP